MTKKDYNLLADAIGQARASDKRLFRADDMTAAEYIERDTASHKHINVIASALSQANAAFDIDKFKDACISRGNLYADFGGK